jgi:predicted acyltransferase
MTEEVARLGANCALPRSDLQPFHCYNPLIETRLAPSPAPADAPPAPAALPAAARLASLDVFRGIAVAGMILVNNPGDWGHIYWPLDHAEWNGWTPTDLIFPFFLFIVGVAGVFSLRKRASRGASRRQLARHAWVRGMTICLLGWGMSAYPFTLERFAHVRIPGVLVRIGVVYILGTWIVLAFKRRWIPVWIFALLALHTWLLLGTGYDLTRSGNIQTAVDLTVFRGHTWKPNWDPEGIVSTLTALATMLTGTLAGWVLISDRPARRKAGMLALYGLAGFAAGEALSPLVPINKGLWTGTFVLLTSGAAAMLLALCFWLVDMRGKRRGPLASFLTTWGTNPIFVFVFSGLLAKTLIIARVAGKDGKPVSLYHVFAAQGFGWIGDPYLRSLAFALATVLFWYLILLALEKKKIYWKI